MTPNQPPTPEKNMTFTNQVPTVPGFYAWKFREQSRPKAFELSKIGEQLVTYDGGLIEPKHMGGLWCLLLPADEIEKAFREALQHFPVSETTKIVLWTDSRAYKIAKGLTE